MPDPELTASEAALAQQAQPHDHRLNYDGTWTGDSTSGPQQAQPLTNERDPMCMCGVEAYCPKHGAWPENAGRAQAYAQGLQAQPRCDHGEDRSHYVVGSDDPATMRYGPGVTAPQPEPYIDALTRAQAATDPTWPMERRAPFIDGFLAACGFSR